MNKINVKVTDETGTAHEGMHLLVRDNIATMSKLGHAGRVKNDVQNVRLSGPKTATVTFVDGTVWTVEGPEPRKRGCGCG